MFKLRWQQTVVIAVLTLIAAGCVWVFRQQPESNPALVGVASNIHLTMGVPKNMKDTSPDDEYLLQSSDRPYVTSYNNSKLRPNWSSWQLNKSWTGNAPRRNDFRPDPALPKGWYQVKSNDYNNSGYDRGHLTPAADRDNNPKNISATFLLTNIVPQAPDNNQGPWAQLENYSRGLAEQGRELYVVAGGYGSQRSIGKGNVKIAVPDRVWKVIVVMDKTGLTASDVTANTRIIAIDMPNEQGIKDVDWRKYRVSVDLIEDRSGYNLLTNLANEMQAQIEGKVDNVLDRVNNRVN